MALPDNTQETDGGDSFRWGTWEELLLAFAVNRHGTGAWPSIASELQKRSTDPNLTLTAQNCRQKYLDLKRRYVVRNDDESAVGGKSNDEESAAASATTLLEELRKLRVAELRREVQRYDLNIESLELKMKSMEEERERTGPDLERKSEETRSEEDVKPKGEPSPEPVAGGDLPAADDLEKDHMSVNESNSTDLGAEKTRTGDKESEPVEAEAAEVERDGTGESSEEPADLCSEPDPKPDREDSCNGSSNSIEKESGAAAAAAAARATESGETVESEAESKGGKEAMKENSDVQSSASRSKEESTDKVRRGNTSGDERDHEDQSRSVKDLPAQSQPLLDFLHVLRSHKLGSVFERRLRSQETSKYQKMILQHVDLETVEQRLKEGWYSGCSSKFFRDLLLIVNNALVFFSKNSSEAQAAIEFRKLLVKEMSQKSTKSESSSRKQISLQSLSLTKKEDREASHSLLLKPRITGSLIVCRKRSSIAAKAAGSSSGADSKKKEQSASLAEEKDTKLQSSLPSENAEEPKITKKRTRDRFSSAAATSSVAANSKKTGKNQSNNSGNKNPVAESGKTQGKGGSSSSLHSEPKGETKKKNQPIVESKKRGAANFLNRMKQSSSSNNSALLDALKNTPLTSESTSSKGGSEQKKNDSGKRGDKKDHQVATKRGGAETRQAKEKGSPAKRNVGRPPKTGTASRPNLGKRGREREPEATVSKQPKKRSKKS